MIGSVDCETGMRSGHAKFETHEVWLNGAPIREPGRKPPMKEPGTPKPVEKPDPDPVPIHEPGGQVPRIEPPGSDPPPMIEPPEPAKS